jgi:hypothetical protein
MSTPMNNLRDPSVDATSLHPGVSGESRNAPYGPKAWDQDEIMGCKEESDMFNYSKSGFAVGKTSGPAEGSMGESSLQP